MIKKGFVMEVYPDMHEEYQKRHEEIWPEMVEAIQAHGGRNYSIFLEKTTHQLFGYIEIESEDKWQQLAKTDINQKWWEYMEPVMKTNPDNSPVTTNLKLVFHLE
ncbi:MULTISPECIES: L-rhamnose mutarotase [Gracilibacillus]|uniref:L-rhamnose mutarotase n=1 Tax=Gracilibacillus TaxID=74385 RepID=UPI000824B4E8|nr:MULTISPECIES: L-rhamnose mutarotase [Gracilibacillus]